MNTETLDGLLEARAARRPVVRFTWLPEGRERVVGAEALSPTPSGGTSESSDDPARDGLSEVLREAARLALRTDRATLVADAGGEIFVHPFNPPLRLAIVGAVHIAQHLADLAARLGYDVTVIDPRRGFLTAARFPGVSLESRWPDTALEAFALDRRSAVVTLSHDAKIDEPALSVALRSDAFYLGALGSRRTQQKRRDRLVEAGFEDAALARIHGPVGLDLGAKSPAEIALSIAAEMTATLRAQATE